MGNTCRSSNRVGVIGRTDTGAVDTGVGTSRPSLVSVDREAQAPSLSHSDFEQTSGRLQTPIEYVDFGQQYYDGRSRVELWSSVKRADFQQQCYDANSRPSSMRPDSRALYRIHEPALAEDGYHKNTFEMVIRIAKELENILTQRFGAEGDGLGQKARNASRLLSKAVKKDLKFITQLRNRLVHEADVRRLEGPDRHSFIDRCKRVKHELLLLGDR